MGKILGVLAVFAVLVACGDVRYSDSEMSNIEVPRDHEGDVDEPIEVIRDARAARAAGADDGANRASAPLAGGGEWPRRRRRR
jgi:hypothetical protein